MRSLIKRLANAAKDRNGSIAPLFALALVPMIGVIGAAADFGAIGMLRGKLQAAADAGALQAAKELRLAQMGSSASVEAIAKRAATNALADSASMLSNIAINSTVLNGATSIEVHITAAYAPMLMRIVWKQPVAIGAKAVASSAGYPICALSLEPTATQSIRLRTQAQVTAQYCAIQANSTDKEAISVQGSGKMTAGMICSSGGAVGQFLPMPITDCPVVADPLGSRPPPTVGACKYTNQVVDGGTLTLTPGNYCGGLHVTNGAIVTLSPGEYVMSNGPLKVDAGSSFAANNAGIYLTGAGATVYFAQDTTVSMTAPTSGAMAGLAFFEDRNAPTGQTHYIYSDNAPMLHGTIYLPQNALVVETNKDVSKASAFTIIVAKTLYVDKASNLWLNSDYKSSNIPVPAGLTRVTAF